MNIAVLGPSGTYTEKAAKEYMQRRNLEGHLHYYSSMRKTLDAIGTECSYGVIPIENTLDGFVQIILDLLTHSKLKIIHEIVLPIRFGFISNANTLSQVERVYAQFKTHNQCLDFLENFTEDQIITTQSNSASYQMLIEGKKTDGAIVPMHFLHQEQSFALEMDDVADSVENETRFIVLSTELNDELSASQDWKTLLVIHDDQDRPGLLVDILNVFAKEKINLVSIISRPTKKGLGNYNFFIDVEGCYQRNKKVREAVLQVMNEFNVVVLGSYYRVK
jgi:prephenate dehydratase